MFRRLFLLLVLAAFGLSACSDQARYNRYVKSSKRAQEKRSEKWRKQMAKANKKQFEAASDVEGSTPQVTVR